jgi:hypothetical protein
MYIKSMANKPIGPIWTNEFDGPNYTDPVWRLFCTHLDVGGHGLMSPMLILSSCILLGTFPPFTICIDVNYEKRQSFVMMNLAP